MIKQILLSIGIVVICVLLFVGTYLLNKRTKKPDGCEDIEENCAGCAISTCSHHPENKKEEKEN
jgi:hypothetical protein